MTDKEFAHLVSLGIEMIPERFLKKINNVAIVIAEKPTEEQLRTNNITPGSTLLGLYEGIPLTERGDSYGTYVILPDKITIFKQPILDEANGDLLIVKEIVRDTVWHEIAHYFGYEDEEIERREMTGKNYSE